MKTPDSQNPSKKVLAFVDSKAEKRKLEEAEFFFDRALQCEDAGDRDNAILDYEEAIKLNPKYAEAMVNLGRIYFKNDEVGTAAIYFTQAKNSNPNYSTAWSNLGATLYGLEAIKCYEKALSLDPKNYYALFGLAVSEEESGHYLSSINHYQQYRDSVAGFDVDPQTIKDVELAIETLKKKVLNDSQKK